MRLTAPARPALLALAAAAVSGCTYYPPPGNMYLSWTFAGASCAAVPNVVSVTVDIPNDPVPITPNVFPCSAGNPPSVLIVYDFVPGNYVVNLSARDASGAVIYAGSATLVVNGDVYATLDLQATAPLLSWSFAPATGIASAIPPCTAFQDPDPDRIDSVALYVDGAATQAIIYDCIQGVGGSQVAAPALAPGSHLLQLVGYQEGIPDAFVQSAPVSVNFGAATSQAFTFEWLVGGIGVTWTYPDPNACTSGAVASVSATFAGPGGYGLSGFPCTTPVAVFKTLPGVTATGASGVNYALGVSAYGPPPGLPLVYTGTVDPVPILPGIFYDGTLATAVDVPLN
jgi:hypothetical protein